MQLSHRLLCLLLSLLSTTHNLCGILRFWLLCLWSSLLSSVSCWNLHRIIDVFLLGLRLAMSHLLGFYIMFDLCFWILPWRKQLPDRMLKHLSFRQHYKRTLLILPQPLRDLQICQLLHLLPFLCDWISLQRQFMRFHVSLGRIRLLREWHKWMRWLQFLLQFLLYQQLYMFVLQYWLSLAQHWLHGLILMPYFLLCQLHLQSLPGLPLSLR